MIYSYCKVLDDRCANCSVVEWVEEVSALDLGGISWAEAVFLGVLLGVSEVSQENGTVASRNSAISIEVHLLINLWQNGQALLVCFDRQDEVSRLVLGSAISNVEVALEIVIPFQHVEAVLETAKGNHGVNQVRCHQRNRM